MFDGNAFSRSNWQAQPTTSFREHLGEADTTHLES